MNTASKKALFATTLTATATALFAVLAPAAATGHAGAPADRIVGAWEYPDVHVFHCATGQTFARFRAASLFHAGGTMQDTNNNPPGVRGPALGVWSYDPISREHTVRMRLYRYNPDGSFAGANEVTRTIRLSEDGNRMSETFRGKILDPAEQLLFESCGSGEGMRSL